MNRQMLSKDDEATSEDVEVRREDQQRINKFSSLHQREQALEQSLKSKHKEKEDLEEINNDLEMIELEGDEETVPYKIGDCFFTLPIEEAKELVEKSTEKLDSDVGDLEGQLSNIREEMESLKVALYARFGRTINLEL